MGLLLLLLLLPHFSSPDFKVLSRCPISIKFGMRVHPMVLYAANDCIMVYFHFLTHRLRTCTIFCGFFGLIILRFGSPDFKVLSYGPISIKFGMRVHLMVLYAANDCIMVYFNF